MAAATDKINSRMPLMRSMLRRGAALVVLAAISMPSLAAEVQGRVVYVIDGDGLIILVGGKRVNVRLEYIDAPEKGQAYGNASRQSLIAICGDELASVHASGKDRNGRTLARVSCNGTHAGAEQVRRGMAWVFERYAPADSPLYAVQTEARAARRGLWAQPEPVPPWEWRKQ
jgi:endonuclease YncB( thermonuclease family)